jgi:hypothetical protein
MRYSVPIGILVSLPLWLSTLGCKGDRNPLQDQVIFGPASDPLERNRQIHTPTKAGHWRVSGRDEAGHVWEGYLVVEHAAERYLCFGYFEWDTKPAGGRYHFEGTFDPETRVVRWTGFTIERRVGPAANAHYEATLSSDSRRLVNGTWSGGVSIPGTWTAEYLSESPAPADGERQP